MCPRAALATSSKYPEGVQVGRATVWPSFKLEKVLFKEKIFETYECQAVSEKTIKQEN